MQRAAFIAPDVEAVVCGDERVTYAELGRRVAVIARALCSSGVEPRDHVAVCAGNGPRWVELFYAISSIGAVVVPVNTRFKADEVRYTLEQSKSRFLVTEPRVLSSDFASMLRDICPEIGTALPGPALPDLEQVVFTCDDDVPDGATGWTEFLKAADEVDASGGYTASPDDVALIQYTSGTTSRPKGVLLTHRSMCMDAYFSGTRMGLRLADRFHSVRPFFHVAGSTLSVLTSGQCVNTLVTMPRFEPGPALEIMERERCTHFSGNDTIALMLLNHPDRASRNLSLRGGWVAAAPAVIRRVIDDLGATEVVVGYGLSEAAPNVAQSSWHEDRELRISAAMLPEPGVEVRIWSLVGAGECGVGERGEIQVRGWSVMQGYFNQPEQTAKAFTEDGWLKTGDIGVMDDTRRITFVGRTKDLIRVGGENVAPAEIENMLHRHPLVKQAVVVGVPDARLGETPFAFVILNEGASAIESELEQWMKDRIAGFKLPRYFRIVDGFEDIGMTASSKIQKNKLREHASSLLEGAK
nr:AMP-binding protein [Spelaeicoccus albus]